MRALLLLLAGSLFCFPAHLGAAEPRLETNPEHPWFGQVVVEPLPPAIVRGLSDHGPLDGARYLVVRVADEGGELPPILGRTVLEADRMRFEPRFPLAAQLPISMEFRGRRLARDLGLPGLLDDSLRSAQLPAAPAQAPAQVVELQPAEKQLPENLLRFYLQFSRPIRGHDLHRSIRLVDAVTGSEVPDAFVEIPSGLWDPSGQRLTLLLHPGRIKRGVGPHQVQGPPLREGQWYRLEVGPGLVDRSGRPVATFEHRFQAGPALRRKLVPQQWTIVVPRNAGDAVTIRPTVPVDSALIRRSLEIAGPQGAVAGSLEVQTSSQIRFRPAAGWLPGRYEIRIDPGLEDVAGNRIDRVFDLATHGSVGDAGEPAGAVATTLEFRVALPPAD